MSARVTRQMKQQRTSSGWSPGFCLCSEVDQLAFLHGALQPLSLRCQGRFLLKSLIPCGIPFCLHTTSVILLTALRYGLKRLRCQGRFLLKGTVSCGIPLCLHMTSVNLVQNKIRKTHTLSLVCKPCNSSMIWFWNNAVTGPLFYKKRSNMLDPFLPAHDTSQPCDTSMDISQPCNSSMDIS